MFDLNPTSNAQVPGSILFVTNLFPPRVAGGAEMSAHALAKGFVERGADVNVFTLKEAGAPEISMEDGIRVHRYAASLPYWPFDQKDHSTPEKLAFHIWDNYNFVAKNQLSAVIQDTKPSIISTQGLVGISAGAWQAAAAARVPVVHSIRDYNALCPRSTMYRGTTVCQKPCQDCRALTLVRKRLSSNVHGVIANSEFVQQTHQAAGYFPSASWTVIAPTIDPAMTSMPQSRLTGPVRFGFAGRISREKGPEWLIDALNCTDRQDWTCIIAGRGDPDYVQHLREKADDRVQFTGWLSPADFYGSIDVLVAPSLWAEPAGRVITEAYAHGLPVIAADHGGLSESVREGATGWLVAPGSIGELAAALSSACDLATRDAMDRGIMNKIALERSTQNAVHLYAKHFAETLASVSGDRA